MIIRFLLAAVVAGLFSGVLMTGAQELKVTPLIFTRNNMKAAPPSNMASLRCCPDCRHWRQRFLR